MLGNFLEERDVRLFFVVPGVSCGVLFSIDLGRSGKWCVRGTLESHRQPFKVHEEADWRLLCEVDVLAPNLEELDAPHFGPEVDELPGLKLLRQRVPIELSTLHRDPGVDNFVRVFRVLAREVELRLEEGVVVSAGLEPFFAIVL